MIAVRQVWRRGGRIVGGWLQRHALDHERSIHGPGPIRRAEGADDEVQHGAQDADGGGRFRQDERAQQPHAPSDHLFVPSQRQVNAQGTGSDVQRDGLTAARRGPPGLALQAVQKLWCQAEVSEQPQMVRLMLVAGDKRAQVSDQPDLEGVPLAVLPDVVVHQQGVECVRVGDHALFRAGGGLLVLDGPVAVVLLVVVVRVAHTHHVQDDIEGGIMDVEPRLFQVMAWKRVRVTEVKYVVL